MPIRKGLYTDIQTHEWKYVLRKQQNNTEKLSLSKSVEMHGEVLTIVPCHMLYIQLLLFMFSQDKITLHHG